MTTTPSRRPAEPEAESPRTRGRRAVAGVAVALTVALCLTHTAFIWLSMEGWRGLTNGWPLWRFDHPLYFHSALVTRQFLRQTWTTAGYDPAFMAGYPKSVIFPASSTLPELVVALFGGERPEFAYKVYVLLAAASVPWLLAASGWLLRLGPGAVLAAIGTYLVYVWSDFPMNYAAYGMLPYLLAVPLGLLTTLFFHRYVTTRALGWWLAAAATMPLLVMVHFTVALIVAPAAALIYVEALWRNRNPEGPPLARRLAFHLGVLVIPFLVLALNAFWWLPGVWLASTKGPSDFAFAHSEGVLYRLSRIATDEVATQRWLWVWGVPGFVILWRRDRPGAIALGSFAAGGFGWGYLAGGFRSLDFLQPGRHTFAFYTAMGLAAGLGFARWLSWLRVRSRLPLHLVGALVVLGLFAWDNGGFLLWRIKKEVFAEYPFLGSRPSPYFHWVHNRVRKIVRPGERLLYEESGFALAGEPDPFQEGHFSGLLPDRLGIELIGGPYLHASLTTNFTQFGEGRLFGASDWDRDHFVRYARLYRPSAIVCWSQRARAFCYTNPDLIQIVEDSQPVLIGRVMGFGGAAIEGKAEVEASPGRLRVRRAEAGLDGWVVLRYHSVPCLRSDPPVEWGPVFLEEDPVPFIRLRPPPGPVTFELALPPRSRGAPAH